MMMMRVLALFAWVVLLGMAVGADDTVCPPEYAAMEGKVYEAVDNAYKFTLAPCGVLPPDASHCGPDTVACQTWGDNTGEWKIIASAGEGLRSFSQTNKTLGEVVWTKYPAACLPKGNAASFTIKCDPSVAPDDISFTYSGYMACVYTFTASAAFACRNL